MMNHAGLKNTNANNGLQRFATKVVEAASYPQSQTHIFMRQQTRISCGVKYNLSGSLSTVAYINFIINSDLPFASVRARARVRVYLSFCATASFWSTFKFSEEHSTSHHNLSSIFWFISPQHLIIWYASPCVCVCLLVGCVSDDSRFPFHIYIYMILA